MNHIIECPSSEGKTCWGFWSGECNRNPKETPHDTCGFCCAYGKWRWDKFEKDFNENNPPPYGNIS